MGRREERSEGGVGGVRERCTYGGGGGTCPCVVTFGGLKHVHASDISACRPDVVYVVCRKVHAVT
jgi:hypothetical protein